MDEPLGALDKKLREHMQIEIKRLHRETGATIVYVTHDQEEALALSDRICLMNHARIEQLGTPREIYERPRTAFAADFIGISNIFRGRWDGNGESLETAHGRFAPAAGRAIPERRPPLVDPPRASAARRTGRQRRRRPCQRDRLRRLRDPCDRRRSATAAMTRAAARPGRPGACHRRAIVAGLGSATQAVLVA